MKYVLLSFYSPSFSSLSCIFLSFTVASFRSLTLLPITLKVLLEGGADPDYGNPNAMQCVAMFRQEEKWKAKFEAAPGKGKAKPHEPKS